MHNGLSTFVVYPASLPSQRAMHFAPTGGFARRFTHGPRDRETAASHGTVLQTKTSSLCRYGLGYVMRRGWFGARSHLIGNANLAHFEERSEKSEQTVQVPRTKTLTF